MIGYWVTQDFIPVLHGHFKILLTQNIAVVLAYISEINIVNEVSRIG